MKEAQKIIAHMYLANSHCQMVKQFSGCTVKHIERDEHVSHEALEEIEDYCILTEIPFNKIDELIDVHLEHCTVRLIKK